MRKKKKEKKEKKGGNALFDQSFRDIPVFHLPSLTASDPPQTYTHTYTHTHVRLAHHWY